MGGKREAIARENLHSYYHLLSWFQQAGLVSDPQVETLRKKAAVEPVKAAEVLGRALELREAVYRIFQSLIKNSTPSAADLKTLNVELARALGRMQVEPRKDGHGFAWGWVEDPVELDGPLGPIAHSAANLLAAEVGVSRLHQCGGDNCGWIFLDSSRNHSRRWCDMRDCGNRAKVRRHRQKQNP
jgi:predicted RNA-binding Zn ribbon-like protein